MNKTKDLSSLIIKKPSFLNLVVGSLIHSLSLDHGEVKIIEPTNLDGYKFLKTIEKENGYVDSFVGYYTKKRKKFFIKSFLVEKKDYRNYFIISEWLASNILYKVLKSKKSQIATPKPIKIIKKHSSVSLVYEFINGKTLSLFSTGYQTKTLIAIFNELEKISGSLTKNEIKFFPKRSTIFYLISLPYLSLLAFFRTERNFKILTAAFLATLKTMLSQKINKKLSLAHRDLKPHNVLIEDSKIFLIDVGRMALTLPGYDLAVLALDPAYDCLTKSLEKKVKISVCKFLTSYIAIQYADSTSPVGKKYWDFLKEKYTNTNLKKGLQYGIQ